MSDSYEKLLKQKKELDELKRKERIQKMKPEYIKLREEKAKEVGEQVYQRHVEELHEQRIKELGVVPKKIELDFPEELKLTRVASGEPILEKPEVISSKRVIKPGKNIDVFDSGLTPQVRQFIVSTFSNYKQPKELEEELYNKYSDNISEYIGHASILYEFSDPESVLGRFSKFFKARIDQNIYPPERLTELSLQEIFPEVYLSESKDELVADIEKHLEKMANNYQQSINNIINIGRKKIVKPEAPDYIAFNGLQDSEITKICANPFWEYRMAATIIIKDSGKFYCIDAGDILKELSETGKAINKYTGNEIPEYITNKIQKRFGNNMLENITFSDDELLKFSESYKRLQILLKELQDKRYLNKIPENYNDIIPDVYGMEADNMVLRENVENMLSHIGKILEKSVPSVPENVVLGDIDRYISLLNDFKESGEESNQISNFLAKVYEKDIRKDTKKIRKELYKKLPKETKQEKIKPIPMPKPEFKVTKEGDVIAVEGVGIGTSYKELASRAREAEETFRPTKPVKLPAAKDRFQPVRRYDPFAELAGEGYDIETEKGEMTMGYKDNLTNVSQEILNKPVTKEIYDDYMNRLTAIKEILEEDLVNLPERKIQITELLDNVNSEIAKLMKCCVSVDAIKEMLNRKRDNIKHEIEKLTVSGSALAYPGPDPRLPFLEDMLTKLDLEMNEANGASEMSEEETPEEIEDETELISEKEMQCEYDSDGNEIMCELN